MNTRQSEQATLTERALRLLATREHSRFELRRKLLRRRASDPPKTHESAHESAHETAHESAHEAAHETAHETAHESAHETAHESAHEAAHETAHETAHESAHEAAHETAHKQTHETAHKQTHETAHKQTHKQAQLQVDTVLDDLANRDLLSDVRFAEAFVRRGVDRGHGPIKIRADLRNRGVMEDIIDDTLTFPDEFWLRRARAVQAKRFGSGGASAGGDSRDAGATANRSEWARRARFLASRGFASDIIYRTLGPQTV